MGSLFLSLLTLVLLLISVFIVLIILMQRTSQNGGMGAALGGGAAESAFGSETNNILTKGTIYGIFAFFVVSLALYLIYQARSSDLGARMDMKTLITAGEEDTANTSEAIVEATKTDVDEGTKGAALESSDVQVMETTPQTVEPAAN